MNPFESIPIGDHGAEVTRLGMGGVFISGRGSADGRDATSASFSWPSIIQRTHWTMSSVSRLGKDRLTNPFGECCTFDFGLFIAASPG